MRSFRDSWFHWLSVATVAVAIGVALEGPEIFHEARDGWFNIETHKPRWLTLVGLVGWLLIVGGVSGEFFLAEVVSSADGLIQTFDNIRIVSASSEAARADERASANERRAAELHNESMQLQTDLANARSVLTSKQAALEREQQNTNREQQRTADAQRAAAKAQLELKKYVDAVAELQAPRRLDPLAVIDELIRKPFGKAEIFFEGSGDLQHFSARLYNILHTAHWVVSPPKLIPQDVMPDDWKGLLAATMRVGGQPTGITLVVATWAEQHSAPVVALFAALRKQLGHEVSINADASVSEGTIRIVVAQKPFRIFVDRKP